MARWLKPRGFHWDIWDNVRSAGTSGGGDLCPHPFRVRPWALRRKADLRGLIIPYFLLCETSIFGGERSLSICCSLQWEFNARQRESRKWEARVQTVGD